MKLKALVIACLCFSPLSYAATSGTLLLKSIVPKVFSLAVTPEPLATTLPLDVTQNNATVAKVLLKANTLNGYRISVSSANQGKLVHESDVASAVTYDLKFGGRNVNLATGSTLTFNRNAPTNRVARIRVSYTGVPHSNLQQGDYTDTVTFTISSL